MILQRFNTPAVDLLAVGSRDAGPVSAATPFRFAGPGIRTMLTLKVIVREQPQVSAIPFDWTMGGNLHWFLWLCRSSVVEGGQRIPVANILGTRSAPVQLDGAALSTNGVSIDHQAGSDGVDGELSVTYANGAPLNLIVASIRGRYNAVAELCDEEWSRVEARCGGYPTGKKLTLTNSLVWS